jgi:hypothetical protein
MLHRSGNLVARLPQQRSPWLQPLLLRAASGLQLQPAAA